MVEASLPVAVWQQPPRSVYIHVPFCTQRCGYCNFALVAGRGDLVEAYLEALQIELEQRLIDYAQPWPIETLFLGGGTPTFLQPRQIDRLVAQLRQRFTWDGDRPDWEWTVEANPNDLSADVVTHWSGHGVTRFSLGAQSFRSEKLKLLERTHTAHEIRLASQRILEADARLSLDLIFAVADETPTQWRADLHAALDCQAQHLSTYQLTFEKGTQFWNRLQRGVLSEAEQDRALELYQITREVLMAAGYEHYEVSNFALTGQRSQHNCVYWTGRPYFAFGPGAASYIQGVRRINHGSTTGYIKRLRQGLSAVAEEDCDGPEMRAREYFVFGMRMLGGIQAEKFARETGFELQRLFGKLLERDTARGWLCQEHSHWRLTEVGLYVSDTLWPDYLEGI